MESRGKEAAINATGGRDATLIDWRERDHALELHLEHWGDGLRRHRPAWNLVKAPARHFYRTLHVSDTPEIEIDETIVPFPSVPIYGINRKAEYGLEFAEKPNMHTLRVLTKAVTGRKRAPITRTFILHNGLNETGNLRFYYRLASWILREDESCEHNSACVIVPFPGHLMHAPFPGPFGQSPLARYLADSGDLFRQFLRYMIEMRWLLSMIIRRRPESWRVGGEILPSAKQAGILQEEWSKLRDASREVWQGRRPFEQSLDAESEQRLLGSEIDPDTVQSTIDVVTHLFGLDLPAKRTRMPVHVVGYSLGGFLAQSVFFAWPNVVASCSTICSGGAIRALSPTAFAHPEEWQAVLHALRPELEESMLGRRIVRDLNTHRIAGMDEIQFGYYQRIFDQVFLQEDNASYKARLSEYATRMLFVSGGEDPIVKTRDVLDAGPDDGITMLSVASLTHFLGEKARSTRETEQREFWLPEAGRLIAKAAKRAEQLQRHELADARREHKEARRLEEELAKKKTKAPPRIEEESRTTLNRDLVSPEFEEALDWVIRGVTSVSKEANKRGQGWIFIFRNGIPAAFLDPDMHRAWGTGLHHHDVSVQKYTVGLAKRAVALNQIANRTTLMLPSRLKTTFVESSSGLVDPHSDAPGYLTTIEQRDKAWESFLDKWKGKARWLRPGAIGKPLLDEGLGRQAAHAFAKAAARWQRMPARHLPVAHLPDVWISLDCRIFNAGRQDEAIAILTEYVSEILAEEKPVPLRSGSRPRAQGEAGKGLESDLAEGRVRIVRVSGSELNPRYRGRLEQAFWPSISILAHCAAALARSTTEVPKDEPDLRQDGLD